MAVVISSKLFTRVNVDAGVTTVVLVIEAVIEGGVVIEVGIVTTLGSGREKIATDKQCHKMALVYLFHKCRHTNKYMVSHTIPHLLQVSVLHSVHQFGDHWISRPIYAKRDTDKVYRLPTSNLNADMTRSYNYSRTVFLSNLSRRPSMFHCNKILCLFNNVVMFGEGLCCKFAMPNPFANSVVKSWLIIMIIVFITLWRLSVTEIKIVRQLHDINAQIRLLIIVLPRVKSAVCDDIRIIE